MSARQSCPSWLYVIRAARVGIFKLGVSSHVRRRLAQLQAESRDELSLCWALPTYRAYELEASLHRALRGIRVHVAGEWFRETTADGADVLEAMRTVLAYLTEADEDAAIEQLASAEEELTAYAESASFIAELVGESFCRRGNAVRAGQVDAARTELAAVRSARRLLGRGERYG
jgi:Meiotically up-regulated gene 113